MKIAVLSHTRVPTLPHGGDGLGRMAFDLADGLAKRGHTVTLCAGLGSAMGDGFYLRMDADETRRAAEFTPSQYDAVLDLSHNHDLSQLYPHRAVVNWIVDLEVAYQPPNAVVGNTWQQRQFPKARIVPLGIDVGAIPFWAEEDIKRDAAHNIKTSYLAYAAKIHFLKGYDIALKVHGAQPVPVRFVGERFVDAPLPDWSESLYGDAFFGFIGRARGLLSPCRKDAGGRVNLEAAATGTPVLCLDGTGTMCHVEHGVSGFICRDADEMVDAVRDLQLLDRAKAREWVRETHDMRVMLDGIEAALQAVADGERW